MQSMTHTTQPVVVQEQGPSLLLRAVYFVLFGLWFSGIWAIVGWVLCVTVVGLPFGLWMLNRLPQVATLKPARRQVLINGTQVTHVEVPQRAFLVRALYFVLVGWWFSALWIVAAWALHATIVGIILGFWMLDRVPAVVTLARQ